MKLKAMIFALALTLTSSAFAQFFPGRVFVTVLPGVVSAEVYNPYYEPIICTGQVFGRTYSGAVISTFFSQQLMSAGSYRYARINAYPVNPFVAGWANINCRFARW